MNKAAAFQFLQQHAGLLSPGITQRYLRSATWALGLRVYAQSPNFYRTALMHKPPSTRQNGDARQHRMPPQTGNLSDS
jgi:hypothetical protein